MKSMRCDWRRIGTRAALTLGAAALLVGCNGSEKPAPPAPAPASAAVALAQPVFKPAVSVNELMVRWVDNAAHVLWDVEKKGFAPKNEADWLELEDHATQLAAAGSLIQMGGTGQADAGWVKQVGWKTNAELLTSSALADLSAAKARNLAGVIKANGDLVASCENCHKEFKPELPSEGVVHQRPHSESVKPAGERR